MHVRRVAAIALRQVYLMRNSYSRVLPLVVWVAIDIVLWGFITRYLNTIASPGFDFVPALLGAVLLWDFLTRVMHGVTMAFFEDVWSRNFLNLFATPISIPEFVGGLVLSSIGTSSLGLLAMLAIAAPLFGLTYAGYGLAMIPYVLVLFLFGIALGITGITVVLRLGPAAEWFVWPIPAIISPFVGVFYPLDTLPVWMQQVARALPPSYVFESMRGVMAGRPFAAGALAAGMALAALYIALATWAFTTVFRQAVRTGLLARYSAESVN
jgi:ABC-2 type transport system permease protein